MSEWKEYHLSELGTLARGKSKHRPRWAEHLYGGKYPFIQTGEITAANKYINKYSQTYSEAGLAQSKLWEKDTLCITIAANIAEIAILKFPACFPDSVLGFIPDYQKADLDFTFYTLKHFQSRLKRLAIGSVQDNINVGTFLNIKFNFPSVAQQKSIADVLSCLDAKIENLRRQNETLEAIAQTLFKHWFIDFEFPNADGKPYKSSGGAMVRSELGDIPEGWRVGKLEELITVNPKESIKNGEIVKYVDMKALSTSSMEITDYVTREFTSGSKFRNKDTLLARITPCLENGKTAFVSILDNEEVAFGSTEFIVLRAKENCCPEYVYPLTRSPYFRDFAVKNMTGSSGRQRIPNDVIANYQLSIPDIKTIKSYQKLCRPLFFKTSSNQKQIQILTKTRDALLPKLMSGQIRIKI